MRNHSATTECGLKRREAKRFVLGCADINAAAAKKSEQLSFLKRSEQSRVAETSRALRRFMLHFARDQERHCRRDISQHRHIFAFIPNSSCGYRLQSTRHTFACRRQLTPIRNDDGI